MNFADLRSQASNKTRSDPLTGPSDPELATAVDSTITRMQRALDQFDGMPHPGPEFPPRLPVNFSDSDADELKRLVLSRLP